MTAAAEIESRQAFKYELYRTKAAEILARCTLTKIHTHTQAHTPATATGAAAAATAIYG